ncbi:hypothetical protein [Streptomyces sp. NPDC048603]|uniref:hypothetical protein n=1 Tax=Streptomyces sp. NPDC048603 TaxID=3365577 RepID=UPI00370FF8D5
MNKTLAAAVKSLTVALVAGTAIFASAGLASANTAPWGAPQPTAADAPKPNPAPWG